MVIIAGTIRLDPSNREAAIEAAVEMMDATAKEDGCVSYDFSADFRDPGLFHLFEEWESEDHLKAHFVVPHMEVFQKKMAVLGPVERKIFRYDASGKQPL